LKKNLYPMEPSMEYVHVIVYLKWGILVIWRFNLVQMHSPRYVGSTPMVQNLTDFYGWTWEKTFPARTSNATFLWLSYLDLQCHMSWSFFAFAVQWVKMVVTFVDFGEIVDHHSLNFLFIIVQMNDWGTIESELLRSKI
jgi:hypothetical protein